MSESKFIKKGQKSIEKKISKLETLKIDYVPANSIKPNTYNPNRQGDHEFELLIRSMEEDGFTQPIVTMQKTREFVDGEHRWTAAIVLHYLQTNNIPITSENIRMARDKRFDIIDPGLLIPVVFVDMTEEQMKISTLRHNKAKGTHDIELEAQVLRDLQALGAADWAMDSLMISEEELNRMLDDIPAPEALAGEEYSNSWNPDDLGQENVDAAMNGSTEAQVIDGSTHGGQMVTAVSHQAVKTIQERQQLIANAKNEEEISMAKLQTKLYRVSLIFAHEEADIVGSVLGNQPAVKLLELCKKEINMSN